jgi:hypothetical protein
MRIGVLPRLYPASKFVTVPVKDLKARQRKIVALLGDRAERSGAGRRKPRLTDNRHGARVVMAVRIGKTADRLF